MHFPLRQEIIRLRIENILLRAKLLGMRKDLAKFTQKYMRDVGDLFAELAQIQGEKNAYQNRLNAVYQAVKNTKADMGESDYESELRRLHRKLLKMVHPDIARDKTKAAYQTRVVHDAYTSRNLPQLIRLDEELSPTRTFEQEKKMHHALLAANYNISLEISQLQEGAEYKLKESFGDYDNNHALMSGIRLKIQRRIAEEKRKLLAYKLDYLESVQRRIVV